MDPKPPWRDLWIKPDRLKRDIEALSAIGRSLDGGLYRYVFSPPYEEPRAWLHDRMASAGIGCRDDSAGNVFGRLGPPGPCVMSGSHIDTVPDGGPLDGAYGVLATLECARVIDEAGVELPRGFEIAAFADEEGRYVNCLGARALTGQLDMAEVGAAHSPDGQPLVEVMRAAGFDPDQLGSARRAAADIAAYVELHIEQGPVLESKGIAIGIMEAIVGSDRSDFYFHGEPDHTGTTPMEMRKDAFMAAAEFAFKARRMALRRGSPSTRLTYGIVDSQPQATNIVPHRVRLRQEIRDVTDGTRARLVANTRRLATRVARTHNLSVTHEPDSAISAAHMAERVQAVIEDAAGAAIGATSGPTGPTWSTAPTSCYRPFCA